MSGQFGTCNLDGKPVSLEDIEHVRPLLSAYALDTEGCFCEGNLGVLFRAFHTTKEARKEIQPFVSASGVVMMLDGHLDNRTELTAELANYVSSESTDLEIAASAYERWGTGSLAKFLGHWALSIYDPKDHSVVLAKDFVGTRHLYYSLEKSCLVWCTILDPLVLLAAHSFALEQEYIAGWLASFPAAHLTPFVGIKSVPPSCFIRFTRHSTTITRYWDFDPGLRTRYRADSDYEEHFRTVFAESVRRCLRSDRPVLAELSGGMDSSSIVCTADAVLKRNSGLTERLDTVSYFDDDEPNWDERPYFTLVERERGRCGCHIQIPPLRFSQPDPAIDGFPFLPSSLATTNRSAQFSCYVQSHDNKVILSGFGGDEFMGGVPTPTPELQDLLVDGQFSKLAHQLKMWALHKRVPWFNLLAEAFSGFCPPSLIRLPRSARPVPWLKADFVNRNKSALRGYRKRVRIFGPLPSWQENALTLENIRRQLSCYGLSSQPVLEKRYPYLDRSLLEFVFSLPREQLVRAGERRSLMRRAMRGIVPEEILSRKRKAFVVRGLRSGLAEQNIALIGTPRLLCSSIGVVETNRFMALLAAAQTGKEIFAVRMVRTLLMEYWLRMLFLCGVLKDTGHNVPRPRQQIEISAE